MQGWWQGGNDECPWYSQDSDIQFRRLRALRHRSGSSFDVVLINGGACLATAANRPSAPALATRSSFPVTTVGTPRPLAQPLRRPSAECSYSWQTAIAPSHRSQTIELRIWCGPAIRGVHQGNRQWIHLRARSPREAQRPPIAAPIGPETLPQRPLVACPFYAGCSEAQRALPRAATQYRNSRFRRRGRDPFCACSLKGHSDRAER